MNQSLLNAVNVLLSNIGQAPVTSLDIPNPMVDLAEVVIAEVSRAVQAEGWVFNKEYAYPFPINTSNEINIPENILALDTQRFDNRTDPVIRNGKLYDKRNHTYKWTENQELDIVWLFDFEDLPEPFKYYITIRSANLFAARTTGSVEMAKYSEREEAAARASVMEYECSQGDYNVFSTTDGRHVITGYQPLNTVYRY